jgi:hypothetical protein
MKHLRHGLLAVALVAFGASGAWAYGSAGSCTNCHMNFGGPGAATHDLHADVASGGFVLGCTYCHTSVGDTPSTGSSGQDPQNGCSGCHVLGGVNRHHATTGASSCGCHSGVAPISESDTPPYYGTAATSKQFSCFDGLDNDGDNDYDGNDQDCVGVPNEERSWSIIKQIYGDE